MASTKQEIIEELKALLQQDDVIAIKEQVDHLKTRFYSTAEEAEEAVAAVEEEFKTLLAQYKSKRAEIAAAQAKEEEANLARKEAILAQMKEMAEDENADGVMANLQKMRDLQAEWKTIGYAPQRMNTQIFERFRAACDNFFQQ